MTWYWSCNCCVWVEATRCAGNTAPPDMRVFVHQDNLPTSGGTKIFSYGGVQYEYNNCWSINPNGPRVALPPGAHRVNPSTLYDNCAECEDDVDEPPSPGGGGGGGGGPGGGGPGGPGGGGPGGGGPGGGGEGETCGVKLQICPEHAGLWNGPDLYVPCSGKPNEVSYVRIYGYCFRVPTGPEVDPIPEGAYFVSVGGSFDDCIDCAYGKKARLCPDQDDVPGIENAPEIWVRKRDLPGETIGFMWGNFCYELRASDPEQVVPLNALILNPVAQFADCSACKLGIQAQRCPTEPDPAPGTDYDVWVEADEAAAFTQTVYFRYRELCYSLDPSATPSRIPFEARTVVPKDEFVDCDTCICGERSEEGDRGIKAHLCPDQDIDLAEDVWVLEEDIPAEVTYFKRGTTCYYVDPSDTPREIPVGSLIARIDNTFENCFDCTSNGGGAPPPHDPPPFDPPPPWWPPLPPENYYQLRRCDTGEMGGWVRENHVCGVFGIAPCDIRGMVFHVADAIGVENGCWEAVEPAALDQPPGEDWTNRLLDIVSGGCATCDTDCADQTTVVGTYTPGATLVLCGDPDAKPSCDTSDGCRELRRRAYCDRYCEYCYDGAGNWTLVDSWYISRKTGERVSASCNCSISDADLDTMLLGAGGNLNNPYRMVVHVIHMRWECKWHSSCRPPGERWVIATGPSWGELGNATLYA